MFGGYTIPTRVQICWYFGTDRFEPEGEFFRATIDDAIYRWALPASVSALYVRLDTDRAVERAWNYPQKSQARPAE